MSEVKKVLSLTESSIKAMVKAAGDLVKIAEAGSRRQGVVVNAGKA
ncbi:TPA: hypothetical protein R4S58_003552 [Enterobacter hormaechei subsp. hoffmannii]|nr:hypothetical protein [Enterobacter hormaechei subsp. hoffmannii]